MRVILVIGFFLTSLNVRSQMTTKTAYPTREEIKIDLNNSLIINSINSNYRKEKTPSPPSLRPLPLFCAMENKIWKKSKINVRFRLGSADYVDKLEQKN